MRTFDVVQEISPIATWLIVYVGHDPDPALPPLPAMATVRMISTERVRLLEWRIVPPHPDNPNPKPWLREVRVERGLDGTTPQRFVAGAELHVEGENEGAGERQRPAEAL